MRNIKVIFGIFCIFFTCHSFCQDNPDRYEIKLEHRFNISALAGIWIPTGEISKLGIHPNLGIHTGFLYSRLSIDLCILVKFQDTKESYLARRVNSTNQLEETNEFFGGYYGFDFGYDIFNNKTQAISILAGIGLDGFDALEADINKEAESIFTSNINCGLGYKKYFNRSFYIGGQVKYNFTNYTKGNIIDMNGCPITALIEIGGLFDIYRKKGFIKYRLKNN